MQSMRGFDGDNGGRTFVNYCTRRNARSRQGVCDGARRVPRTDSAGDAGRPGPGPSRVGRCPDSQADSDVHQGRRANLPGEVRVVPSARLDRADVARDLRRGAALGALDQEPRRRAPDAALAHRQDRRHPALPERSLADRRADRHHRPLGRRRRAEGRPEGHAAAGQVGRRQRLELRAASSADRPI